MKPSESGKLNREDWILFGKNLVKFVAPTIAIFFSLLSQGVPVEKAWPVAAFALYQAISDLFGKWSAGK